MQDDKRTLESTDILADLRELAGFDRVGRTAIRAAEEIEELRTSVIAFGAPWAANYAADFGFPPGHLHPTHYDILARCGARMNGFVRGEIRQTDNSKTTLIEKRGKQPGLQAGE